ncbi:ribosome maturation factor RimM [Aeromicrobium terrae]|uniref:Ribosome maturation factor RimM n=1 Tax=Aeromicrobium terrae TaxID=2498846 RepID=A0A5C8NJW2_9ACTN|nr:ribosome maturation factor RimM [Aeromicrobium terrae]TXL61145.1 ribosome maturation factor RimM [Aeromicrobium terrae]
MLVVVGRLSRAHGIRGEIAVTVRTDEPERRFAPGSSLVCGGRTLTVRSSRHHSGRLLVAFEEVPDRTAAEQLTGNLLEAEIDPSELPDDPEEFYDHQLVDLQVQAADGTVVGTVTSVLHLPEQDSLVVDVDGREVIVPFVEALVPEVDLTAGHVRLSDVPGLLDPEGAA